jgi:hypothetical protein
MFMKALPLALLTFAVAGLACSSVDMTGIGVVTGGGAGTVSGGAGGFGGTGGTVSTTGGQGGSSAGNGGSTGGGAGGSAGSGSDMASEPLPADVPGTLLSNGDGCTSASECKSSFCVDGVCCDTACQGGCQACVAAKSAGVDGQCRAVPVGNDPDDECAADTGNVCGRTGACSGMNGCAMAPSGMACGDTSCMGNTLSPRPRCNGSGTCAKPPVESCPGNLTCANATTCKASCVSDGDCVGGTFCDTASGRCRSIKPVGAACDPSNAGSDCASGSCVDGFCCDTACRSLCSACSMTRTGAANGRCAPVRAGTDPDNECASQPASSCGRDGTCDGAGACRLHADGTQCGSGCCDNGGPSGRAARPCSYACKAGVCDTANPTVQPQGCGILTCCCPNGGVNGQAACTTAGACTAGCQ